MRDVTELGTTMLRDFVNAKIEVISDCRASARQRMVKGMVRRDSAHRIDLVRHPPCLAVCSGSISIWTSHLNIGSGLAGFGWLWGARSSPREGGKKHDWSIGKRTDMSESGPGDGGQSEEITWSNDL